ncbi:MAG: L,D-transpeptidase family protein [Campylobacterota bacterium]|nr:L,D-transpeptidase family protein [Campylobacterota bacterium]
MKIRQFLILAALLWLLSGCKESSAKLAYKKGNYEVSECRQELRLGNHFADNKKIDRIVVDKSERKMYLYKKGKVLHTLRISLGKNPNGHKIKIGDHRTPEGSYMITYKKCHPKYYRMISLSYPNRKDLRDANKRGVSPGSGITIHAQPFWNADGKGNRFTLSNDWTNGCIAVTNYAMDLLWYSVKSGTPIQITA